MIPIEPVGTPMAGPMADVLPEEVEEEKEYQESDFVVHIPLTDLLEMEIKKIFKTEMSLIQNERQELFNGQGLEQQLKDNQNLYDGIIKPPDLTWNSANYHIWVTTMMIDIAVIMAKEHTLMNTPMVLLEPNDEFTKDEIKYDLRDREDKLDYKLRKQIEIEKLLHSVYQKTFIHGTSFVKVPMMDDVEWACYKETYTIAPTEARAFLMEGKTEGDIKRFLDDFPDHTLNPKEEENFQKLIATGTVTVTIEEQQKIYYGVRPYRIDIEKLWLRPKIKDLRRQRMIAEEIDFVWSDMDARFENGYYLKGKKEELIGATGSDNYQNQDYTVFECRLFCDLEKQGKMMRYMATIDKKTETILRLVYYPYRHKKLDIVPFYIMPKDDCVYGYGICERQKDSNKMLDNAWNITFDGFTLSQNPLIATDDVNLDFTARDFGPLSLLRHEKGTIVRPFELARPKMDTLVVTQMSERFCEFGSGIPVIQSGREAALDPRAPMGKVAMLLDRSDRRIRDYIKELHKSFALLAELIEKTEMQFNPDDYKWMFEGYAKEVNKLIYGKDVRYTTPVLHMDKGADLQLLIGFIQFVIAYYPEKMQDPEIRYQLMKCYIDNIGGSVERIKNIINKSPEEQQKEILQSALKELVEAMAQGDNERVQQILATLQGGGAPPPPPVEGEPPLDEVVPPFGTTPMGAGG